MDLTARALSAQILAESPDSSRQEGPEEMEPGTQRHCSDLTGRLSSEMLAACFGFLRLRDLLLGAAHVSRSWRSSALAFPALWSCIRLSWPAKSPDAVLDVAIERAGELPVDFALGPYDAYGPLPNGLLDAIGRHMHRFRSFEWARDARTLDLALPAPLLATFVSAGNSFCPLPRDFLGRAQSLRTLRLAATSFPPVCPALKSVTRLRAACPRFSGDLGFHRLFALCPRLERLHLRHVHTRPEGELPTGPAPKTLRVLKLHANADCDLVRLFGGAPGLRDVPLVRLKVPADTSHTLAPFLTGARELAVTFDSQSTARAVATMPDGRVRALVLCELARAFRPAVVFARILFDLPHRASVRALRLPLALLVLVAAAEMPWPAVGRLTVDIDEDDKESYPFAFGDGPRRFRWAPLDSQRSMARSFTVLESLVLAVRCADGSMVSSTISGADLSHYLSEDLHLTTPAAR